MFIRKIRIPFIAIITLVVLTTVILAPFLVSGAGYLINVLVVESNSTSYTNLPIIASLNNTYLANNGYISSTGLDTRIFDAANNTLKHLVADNKTLFVSNITASSTASFEYKSWYSALTSFPIIVGQGGYVTTADNATLEPSDYFTIELNVNLLNTGIVFEKQDALKLDYNATTDVLTFTVGNESSPSQTLTAGNVTPGEHTIKIEVSYTGDIGSAVFLYPAGVGSYENILVETPDAMAHWQILQDPADEQYIWFGNGAIQSDLYTFDDGSIYSFDSISLWFYTYSNYPFSWYKPLIKMSGQSLYTGSAYDPYSRGNGSWFEVTYLTNPVTGLPWQASDLVNIQFGISVYWYSGGEAMKGMKVSLNNPSGLPELKLYVDDMETPADIEDLSVAVPDNSNDWVWYPDPYINYIRLETAN